MIKSTKESGVEGEGHSSEGNILTHDFDRFAKAPPRPQSASGRADAAYYSSIFAVMDAAAGYGPTGRSGAGSGRRDSGSSADTVPGEETPERRSDQRPNPLRGYNLVQKPAQSAAESAFSRFAQPAVVETLESVVSGELSVNSDQSPVAAAPVNGPATENLAAEQEAQARADALWNSPSARAARITEQMIEHRRRKRRTEM